MHPPKLLRGLFGWYYTRIYVHVRPERVFVWADGDVDKAPDCHGAHMEEVRSGHSEEPLEPHEPPDRRRRPLGRADRGARPPPRDRGARLGGARTASRSPSACR